MPRKKLHSHDSEITYIIRIYESNTVIARDYTDYWNVQINSRQSLNSEYYNLPGTFSYSFA